MGGYSRSEVARICRVPASRLRRWERMALLRPAAPSASRARFEFRDLVSVRRLRHLLDRGATIREIHNGVQVLRRRRPELARPVDALEVWMGGGPRIVLREAGLLAELDGQLVLDFARHGEGPRGVALVLRVRSGSPRSGGPASRGPVSRTADEWFEVGCRLDSERETYAEAIEAYRRALEVDPEHADAHCNLGAVFYNQGRRGAARACFERVLGCEPGHVEANLNLATLLEEEGRNQAALRHYKVAMASDPLHPDAQVSAALLYEKLGLRRAAHDHWRRYLQLDPAGAWADVARRHLEP